MTFSKPWLKSCGFDFSFFFFPSLLAVFMSFVFARAFENSQNLPPWAWVVFILGIDVSHVYSTLFRTYFNSQEFKEHRILLTLIPWIVWLFGVLLYSIQSLLFWRVLAYLAVFHFIRQQYGFLRLYCRKDIESKWDRWLSAAVIYLATLYPLIHWHCHQPRNFHWFIEGDFFGGWPVGLSQMTGVFYNAILFFYVVNEMRNVHLGRSLNIPKNGIVLCTGVSWYVGIVSFNSDLIFTMTNVISHGVPYLALIWLYGEKQGHTPLIFRGINYKIFFSRFSFPLFFAVLLLFGYFEEGLWAGLVWREHLEVFGVFRKLPEMNAKDTLSWLVPLLTLPQVTHYVLDGFIWKIRDADANWQKVVFAQRPGEA